MLDFITQQQVRQAMRPRLWKGAACAITFACTSMRCGTDEVSGGVGVVFT